jgi:hypothetical protein
VRRCLKVGTIDFENVAQLYCVHRAGHRGDVRCLVLGLGQRGQMLAFPSDLRSGIGVAGIFSMIGRPIGGRSCRSNATGNEKSSHNTEKSLNPAKTRVNCTQPGSGHKGGIVKKGLACTMLLGVVWSLPAAAQSTLQFNGGIGVHPVSTITGCPTTDPCTVTPTFNIVRNVHPAGQVWVINSFTATVRNGSITVNGKGLVLAGGNNAGRALSSTGGQFSVFATLICEASAPFTERDTNMAGVLVSPTGDFQINDTIKPTPPASCASPMLLIRNAAPGGTFPNTWFAVGIYSPNGGQSQSQSQSQSQQGQGQSQSSSSSSSSSR